MAMRPNGFRATSQGVGPPSSQNLSHIIVGGGISGLSAAHYFRKAAGASARILIVENHDDFGGHAKRNEFGVGNRTLLAIWRKLFHRKSRPVQSHSKGPDPRTWY